MQLKHQWKKPTEWRVVATVATAGALGVTGLVVVSQGEADAQHNPIDLKERVVISELEPPRTGGGAEVELSAREFALAETLMSHANQVLSREQLLSRVWGYDFEPGSNIVDVYIGYLRKKLGQDLIDTVRGMGYRLRDR